MHAGLVRSGAVLGLIEANQRRELGHISEAVSTY